MFVAHFEYEGGLELLRKYEILHIMRAVCPETNTWESILYTVHTANAIYICYLGPGLCMVYTCALCKYRLHGICVNRLHPIFFEFVSLKIYGIKFECCKQRNM